MGSESNARLDSANSARADDVCRQEWIAPSKERPGESANALDDMKERWARQSLLAGQLIAGQVMVGG